MQKSMKNLDMGKKDFQEDENIEQKKSHTRNPSGDSPKKNKKEG